LESFRHFGKKSRIDTLKPARKLLFKHSAMSRRYLVLTEVEGRLRMFSLLSNEHRLEELARQCAKMLGELLGDKLVDKFSVCPWPILEPALQPARASR